ncbi:V-type ATP synthase subunit F [bacterium]|nr:V-type ATP synthase subunit F [bacterium]
MDFFVIGDDTMVFGFGLVGIPGVVVHNGEQLLAELKKTISQKVKIIMVSERLANEVKQQVETALLKVDFPLVIEIPDRKGLQQKRTTIRQLLKTTLGFSV